MLLPLTPWQAVHTAALVAPASAEPLTGILGGGGVGEPEAGANERSGQAQRKSALNHGLAGSLEGGELYTSVCRLEPKPPMSQYPNVRFLLSAASEEQFPEDVGAEVAFAGRSNSGKSSAINTIMVRNGLARASKTPGRTRLLNFFEVEDGTSHPRSARLRLRRGEPGRKEAVDRPHRPAAARAPASAACS